MTFVNNKKTKKKTIKLISRPLIIFSHSPLLDEIRNHIKKEEERLYLILHQMWLDKQNSIHNYI